MHPINLVSCALSLIKKGLYSVKSVEVCKPRLLMPYQLAINPDWWDCQESRLRLGYFTLTAYFQLCARVHGS